MNSVESLIRTLPADVIDKKPCESKKVYVNGEGNSEASEESGDVNESDVVAKPTLIDPNDVPHPVTTLTKREERLIQSSWEKVNANQKASGLLLFKNLFTDYPDKVKFFKKFEGMQMEKIFKSGLLGVHACGVMKVLTDVIENIDDVDIVVDILKKQGVAHYPWGIRLKDFLDLNKVLMRTLKEALPDELIGDTEVAWSKALVVVANVSNSGVEEAKKEAEEDAAKDAENDADSEKDADAEKDAASV